MILLGPVINLGNDRSYLADSSQKRAGSLIVVGGNPQVLLQLGKEVPYQVSPAILASVKLPGLLLIGLRGNQCFMTCFACAWMHSRLLLIGLRGNQCFRLMLLQAIQQPCFCSVGNVCQQCLDLIQKSSQQQVRTLQVMGLTWT